jgi:hypothetical protein
MRFASEVSPGEVPSSGERSRAMRERFRRLWAFIDSHKLSVGTVLAAVGIVVAPVAASATAYDPTSDLTTLATNTGTSLGPIVVAVVTALIGIFILMWGVHWVLGLFRSRRERV